MIILLEKDLDIESKIELINNIQDLSGMDFHMVNPFKDLESTIKVLFSSGNKAAIPTQFIKGDTAYIPGGVVDPAGNYKIMKEVENKSGELVMEPFGGERMMCYPKIAGDSFNFHNSFTDKILEAMKVDYGFDVVKTARAKTYKAKEVCCNIVIDGLPKEDCAKLKAVMDGEDSIIIVSNKKGDGDLKVSSPTEVDAALRGLFGDLDIDFSQLVATLDLGAKEEDKKPSSNEVFEEVVRSYIINESRSMSENRFRMAA
jgi:hypothetical protein